MAASLTALKKAVLKGRSFSCAENSFLGSGFSRVRN